MMVSIRPATLTDLDQISALLTADAHQRFTANPKLWPLVSDPQATIHANISAAMQAEKPPFRQQWLVAEADGTLIGVTHSILLPVPPIYAGAFGPPGLIMEDCHVSPQAPAGTHAALLKAAEDDLIAAGAHILLGSSIAHGAWEDVYARTGYDPLTCYFAKSDLNTAPNSDTIHPARPEDIPAIVTASATHRQKLTDLHPVFWKPHPDADARFGAWMTRSLTLTDRDMFVSKTKDTFGGYAISQPATPLHFPAPHDISGIGVIDDFFHDAIANIAERGANAADAAALFTAAEAARRARNDHSVLVVCPAAWTSKIALLEHCGYASAITWYYKFHA